MLKIDTGRHLGTELTSHWETSAGSTVPSKTSQVHDMSLVHSTGPFMYLVANIFLSESFRTNSSPKMSFPMGGYAYICARECVIGHVIKFWLHHKVRLGIIRVIPKRGTVISQFIPPLSES